MKSLRSNSILILVSILFSFLIVSCKRTYTPAEYVVAYAKSNEINKVIESEDIAFKCSYLPAEYLALKETNFASNINLPASEFQEEVSKFNNAYYFQLTIVKKNDGKIIQDMIHSQAEYAAFVYELNNNMSSYFYALTPDNDTLKVLGSTFTNPYSIGSSLDFTFAFPKEIFKNNSTVKLRFDGRILNMNNIDFDFKESDLTSIGKLNIQ